MSSLGRCPRLIWNAPIGAEAASVSNHLDNLRRFKQTFLRRMAMHLHRPIGDFWWNVFSWQKLLSLAERYGWRPAGTTLSDSQLRWMPNGKWDGNYTSNGGQTVATVDASALALALGRAIHDIPSEDVISRHRAPDSGIQILPNPPSISDLDWFCGPETKARIREFISFCNAGEFQIS